MPCVTHKTHGTRLHRAHGHGLCTMLPHEATTTCRCVRTFFRLDFPYSFPVRLLFVCVCVCVFEAALLKFVVFDTVVSSACASLPRHRSRSARANASISPSTSHYFSFYFLREKVLFYSSYFLMKTLFPLLFVLSSTFR